VAGDKRNKQQKGKINSDNKQYG